MRIPAIINVSLLDNTTPGSGATILEQLFSKTVIANKATAS